MRVDVKMIYLWEFSLMGFVSLSPLATVNPHINLILGWAMSQLFIRIELQRGIFGVCILRLNGGDS